VFSDGKNLLLLSVRHDVSGILLVNLREDPCYILVAHNRR
jgi:hypothetical protein